jgi:selenocysteine-specific elongation factor
LTKIDALDDPEWAQLVEEDVHRLLAETSYAAAPVVRVSARTGEGLEALRQALATELEAVPAPRDRARPRLPVDRAFVMSGFGTVVTGTLRDGALHVGQEIVVLPGGAKGRVRGLQTHRRPVEQAIPGSRVAVNIAGVDLQEVGRGDTLSTAGAYTPTRRMDVHLRVLPDAPVSLRHGQWFKIYLGTSDVLAKVRLLERDEVPPGESGWAQLVLEADVVAANLDRFILRRPTPAATIGGGEIVAAQATRAHRRRDSHVLQALEQLRRGSPSDRLLVELASTGPVRGAQAGRVSGLNAAEAAGALKELISDGRIVRVSEEAGAGEAVFASAEWWGGVRQRAASLLETYHGEYPHRPGMPREELRARLGLAPRSFELVITGLQREGTLHASGSRVAAADFAPRLTDDEAERVAELKRRFAASPASPPSIRECREAVGEELWSLLTARGDFVEVSEDVVFEADAYRHIVGEIVAALGRGETITVAQVRDKYRSSRKFALALLEHLDATGVTVRVGDERRLKSTAGQNFGPPSG